MRVSTEWRGRHEVPPSASHLGDQKRTGGSAMIGGVGGRPRLVVAGCAVLAVGCTLASCGGSPARRAAPTTTTASSTTSSTTSTTTTTTTAPPTTLPPGVGVPNVVGMKIDLARFYLQTAGFSWVPFNKACNRGTLPSQSVVAALSIPGRPPDVIVGAQPLPPGTLLPKGSRVGITWSGCYPAGTTVPLVTGHTFAGAVHLLHLAALNWACYSVGPNASAVTTTSSAASTSSAPTTMPATTTTTTRPAASGAVVGQGTKAGTTVQANTVVVLFMHRCPQ